MTLFAQVFDSLYQNVIFNVIEIINPSVNSLTAKGILLRHWVKI